MPGLKLDLLDNLLSWLSDDFCLCWQVVSERRRSICRRSNDLKRWHNSLKRMQSSPLNLHACLLVSSRLTPRRFLAHAVAGVKWECSFYCCVCTYISVFETHSAQDNSLKWVNAANLEMDLPKDVYFVCFNSSPPRFSCQMTMSL